MRRSPVPALVLAISASFGCSHTRTLERPTTVLSTYVNAISEGELEDAYACLSAETRAAIPYETFVEHLRRDRNLTRLRLRALARRPATTGSDASVTIEGETIPFVLETAGFRIVGNPVDAFDQTTPRGAIRAFALALAERRAEWVVALAPPSARELLDIDAVRAALAEEADGPYGELADALATSGEASLDLHPDHASMRVGLRRTLRLVRVDGLWFIDGID